MKNLIGRSIAVAVVLPLMILGGLAGLLCAAVYIGFMAATEMINAWASNLGKKHQRGGKP